MKESEFGKGLCYCLGLFLAHAEREGRPAVTAESWFNGASDHFYELQVPTTLPPRLRKRLAELQEKALHWGHGFKGDAKEEDKTWAITEAKNLLLKLDKLNGVETQNAQWD